MKLVNFLCLTLCTSTTVFLAPIFAQAIAYSALPMVSAIGLIVMIASFTTLATIAVIR